MTPEQIEIRDAQGNLLGYFIPVSPGSSPDYSEIRKLFDPQEVKRRKERSGKDPGRSLDQIMDRLRATEKE